ncbi:MAG: RNA polymerase sigma-70 factor [Bacteroidaceae bacterium]|nr:RNA polymerase sigma-70 factor [Bacteroidaceae bacterium]
MQSEHSDRIMICLLKQGDYEAFELFFSRYRSKYYYFILKLVKDNDVAQDIVQNIFMKLWVNRENLDENLALPAYLYVMAKHEICNHFRAIRNHKTSAIDEGCMSLVTNLATPYEDLTFAELSEKVNKLIDALPPKRRRIFKMSRIEHIKAQDIANELGISVRTVEKHLELALRTLRGKINTPVLFLFFITYYE